MDDEAAAHLAAVAGGDARIALNTLEVAGMTTPRGDGDRIRLTVKEIDEALQHRSPQYDKGGDWHFDAISALHKSVRDSDPDGALYWLARMLIAGDDPLYIARRIIRMSVEDIGLADPFALTLSTSAQQAVHFVGQPEGDLMLAHAVVYLATAPKSNAVYAAFSKARQDAEQTSDEPVPMHLRNAPTRLMKEMGHGKGYKYAHDYDGAVRGPGASARIHQGASLLRAHRPGPRREDPRVDGEDAEDQRRGLTGRDVRGPGTVLAPNQAVDAAGGPCRSRSRLAD